jgi:eukaryotic-like serine/threonine-protein kinase
MQVAVLDRQRQADVLLASGNTGSLTQKTLGAYQAQEPLGRGGMGDV